MKLHKATCKGCQSTYSGEFKNVQSWAINHAKSNHHTVSVQPQVALSKALNALGITEHPTPPPVGTYNATCEHVSKGCDFSLGCTKDEAEKFAAEHKASKGHNVKVENTAKLCADDYICQVCARIYNHTVKNPGPAPVWRPDLTGCSNAGNVCPECYEAYKSAGMRGIQIMKSHQNGSPLSVYEWAEIESGGLTGQALENYVSRHYKPF